MIVTFLQDVDEAETARLEIGSSSSTSIEVFRPQTSLVPAQIRFRLRHIKTDRASITKSHEGWQAVVLQTKDSYKSDASYDALKPLWSVSKVWE
ncbi:hypothetical protein R1sor_020775 [Riccia sorocarpa]|uniref:Uncharacterized protein n=1 Tax=Riccia sorocarpa TaxID=122646 RepID=A0ABD3GH92_9MARC